MSFSSTVINEDFYRTGGERRNQPLPCGHYPPVKPFDREKYAREFVKRLEAWEEKAAKDWARRARVERFKVTLTMGGYPKSQWPLMFKLNGIEEE